MPVLPSRHNLQSATSPLRGNVFEGDISQIDWIQNGTDVRLLAAGAPCQPFSIGGSRKGPEDQRNLFPVLLKALRAVRPRAVLIENVRGLDRGPHKLYLEYVIRQLRYIDVSCRKHQTWQEHDRRLLDHSADKHARPSYNVQWAVLNAADFGVAQIRYRLFIVATEIGAPEYRFPQPTHSKLKLLYEQAAGTYWETRGLRIPENQTTTVPHDDQKAGILRWTTVRDVVTDLPPLSTNHGPESNNHCVIPGARSYPGHSGSRLDWPSKTLKAGVHGVPGGENTMVCDDGSLRYYSMREMARIQSFPDHHYFPGARSNIARQIGNAVPCDLAAAVAQPLSNLLG